MMQLLAQIWGLLGQAQQAASDAVQSGQLPQWFNLDVGNVTATAVLGWYAWHTASRTIPDIVKNFREELADERTAFREELREERQARSADSKELAAAIRELKS